MGELPKALAQRQEHQRQQSVNLVMRAIAELSAEGHKIRIKDLIERTGLSRSIFCKPHIRQLLIDKGICEVRTADAQPRISARKTQCLNKLEEKLRQKDEYIHKLRIENQELEEECALLRGKLFLLMQNL